MTLRRLSATLLRLIGALSVFACTRTVVTRDPGSAQSQVEFRLARDASFQGAVAGTTPDSRVIHMEPTVLASGPDIRAVAVDRGQQGYDVLLFIHEAAAARLHQATAGNVGQRIAILVDGAVVLAPVLTGPIGSDIAISGGSTREEAMALAKRLAP